jgi:hypothetical protein
MVINLTVPALAVVLLLCSCSNTRPSEPPTPVPAHSVDPEGSAVPGAPEPEVVQLISIVAQHGERHITVGNIAGDYELVCNEEVNDKEKHPFPSCILPQPQTRSYLINTFNDLNS